MYTVKKHNKTMKTKKTKKKYANQTKLNIKTFGIKPQYSKKDIMINYAIYKKCAATANAFFKTYKPLSISKAIIKACNSIIHNYNRKDFPIHLLQSHTNINMNLNEVIAKKANSFTGKHTQVDPLLHVNKSQSSNDSFYTTSFITIAIYFKDFIQDLKNLLDQFKLIKPRFSKHTKMGKTHLVNAIPIKYTDQINGYIGQIQQCLNVCNNTLKQLYEIPAGLTMVGNGDNAPYGFDDKMIKLLRKEFKLPLRKSEHPFTSLSSFNAIVNCNQNLSLFASNFKKIAFDVNIMYGNEEIVIPKISIGSSFKPSKVNCTVCESVQMNTIKVMGNTHEVVSANSKGNLQLNVFIPLVTFNTLESIELLKYSVELFIKGLLSDIKMNDKT